MYDPNVVNHAAVVLKELLAERGHQFATVTPELRRIPPSSLEVIFQVDEGPKIKVGKITILGNKAFSQREVIRAMKNLKPHRHSALDFLRRSFPKTFDAAKLEEDKERIRDAYQKEGYFTAKALDQTLNLRDTGGANGGFHIPLIKENKPGQGGRHHAPGRRRPALLPRQNRFHRRQAVPLHRLPRPRSFRCSRATSSPPRNCATA